MTSNNRHILTRCCIQYFGQMTASATHELKNALAIFNENVGLLNDLTALSDLNQTSLPQERIKRIGSSLKKQVLRSDELLKRLNRFSHSADKNFDMIDLENTLRFVTRVGSRLIEMMGVTLKITGKKQPIMIKTNLFYFQAMLWRAIEAACGFAGNEKNIGIIIIDHPSPAIWFSTGQLPETKKKILSSEMDVQLIADLYAVLELDLDNNRFGLIWPDQKHY